MFKDKCIMYSNPLLYDHSLCNGKMASYKSDGLSGGYITMI